MAGFKETDLKPCETAGDSGNPTGNQREMLGEYENPLKPPALQHPLTEKANEPQSNDG